MNLFPLFVTLFLIKLRQILFAINRPIWKKLRKKSTYFVYGPKGRHKMAGKKLPVWFYWAQMALKCKTEPQGT